MTKKRFLIAIAIVMVLILSVAVFVACNENQTKSYTVKFVDGESEVKSVSVEEGKTIADADVPADLTKDGYVFEGWYVGDVAFDKSAAITADVTYSAKWTKLHTVKFVDGDETIKTATVKDGEKLKDADIPADLTATGKAFEGWFDGTTAFDKDATITADKTFAAKWVGLFNVTFKNGEETIKVAQVKDGAVIAAADIPEDPTDDNYAFIGWFVGETAYDSSAAVTSDIVVNAKFGNINKTLIGTWKGGTLDRSSYTYIHYVLVIGADSIKADLGDGTLVDASNIVWNEDYQTYDFNLAGDTLYSFGEYHGAYSFASADYSVYTNLSKLETGVVSADETALAGTFETKGGVTIGINSTFVTINGVDATEFEYSERDAKYTFYIDDASASIEYDSTEGQWFYVVGGEKDQLVIASMAPAAIPEAYFGVWSNATIGAYSVTTITINADGVFDGGYKIGKVASADATSMTVKSPYGDYIFTLGDGTLTMNNGYSDIVLDKNVKVVFIAGEGYQAAIFYVAKVGADGKIDMGSFALEDPTMAAGYTFKGWFGQDDSTVEFDEDATFTQNTIFVSKIEKTGYVLTFKKSSSDSEPVVVVVDKATGKLAASQIPADLTYEDGSVFTGWYTTAGVKAVADLTISDDTTFIAKSVKESDYEGTWVSTAKGKEAVLVVADGKVSFGEISGVSYTFNADGSISYGKWGDGSAKYSFVLTNSGIKATYRHLDADGYDFEEDVYELVTPKNAGLNSRVAGTYQYNKSDVIVIDANGIITKFGSSAPVYGFVTGTSTSNLTISYKASKYSRDYSYTGCSYKVKYMIIDKKIYVKDVKSAVDYYNTDAGSIIEFTRMNGSKEEKLYTYKYSYLATIEGTVADGEIVTVSYTDSEGAKSMVIKINGTKYIVAGAERGTHTGDEGALVLDGFDKAQLGDAVATTYTVGGQGYILIGDKAYVLKDGAYTVISEKDGYQGSFKLYGGSITLDLDGFGGATAKKSSSLYYGTYTVDADKNEITFADVDESYSYTYVDGTYSIVESGNVYTNAKSTWVKNGYTVADQIESLKGFYKSTDGTHSIEIVKASSKVYVKLDGTVYTAKGNYNNSILTISVDGKSMTITKDGEGIAYAGADSSIALAAATLTFDVDTTKLEGTWELFAYYYYTFAFDADGKLVASRISDYGTHTETVNYTVNENVVKFSFYYEDFICTLADGALAVVDDGDSIGSARKIADPIVELDAFEGTWKTADGKFTFTFDGKGTVTNEDGKSYAYTIASEKASFSAGGIDIECTISGNTLTASYDDGESPFTKTFTKEAAETLDAFAGTWVKGSDTIVFDGKGNGNQGAYTFSYTVGTDGKATFSYGSRDWTAVLSSDGNTITVSYYDDDAMTDFSFKYTKQA